MSFHEARCALEAVRLRNGNAPEVATYEHLVAPGGELAHAGRRDRDAVLVGLDLGRDPDPHLASSRPRSASQNSIRSRALERSRPVSCSILRIR